jgi:hypothetical protein
MKALDSDGRYRYTEADKAAVKILRSLYLLSETDGGDVLYNARQYLQDRARYAHNAAILARTGRALAMNFDVPARDIIGMACAEMGVSESTWREMQGHCREEKWREVRTVIATKYP